VLAHIDLQAGHEAIWMAREQRAHQRGSAAGEFDDALPGQWHQFGKDSKLVKVSMSRANFC
jgi:hypothetical protein